eukprot:Blabericola_migrator_1__4595@NODE_243_length_10934_cov_182_833625_g205_i0_p8_GENE_NODE_243_length_10934_cov_182_833625_g205_i0NODE_243_length_10934_cov_182_833625_g205_i0_p8_ORF_typecomplete_len143_score17_99Pkinase_Tyr/PF07714_17/2e19Pkinase/PF00069_25/1_7e14Kinaselike/PF14531_6/0_026Importin_rep_3/PF18806_1/0_29_NODE_243_length_10934_cov_182_833625_g205_i042754703
MAPETLRGERHTYKSDVYAFGLVLWELLTNKIPFADLASKTITAAVGYGRLRVRVPRSGGDPLAEILGDLVTQCTDPDPEKRPSFDVLHQRFRELMKSDKPSSEAASRGGLPGCRRYSSYLPSGDLQCEDMMAFTGPPRPRT